MTADFISETPERELEQVDSELGFDAETQQILAEAFQQHGQVRIEFNGQPRFPNALVHDMDSLKLAMEHYQSVVFKNTDIRGKKAFIRFKPLMDPTRSEFSQTRMILVTLVPDSIVVNLKSGRPHTMSFEEAEMKKDFSVRLTIDIKKPMSGLTSTKRERPREKQRFFPNLKFPPIAQKFTINRPRTVEPERAPQESPEEIEHQREIREFLANEAIRVVIPREAFKQYLLSIPIPPEMEENRKANVNAVLAHHLDRDIPLKIDKSSRGSIFLEYRGQSVEITLESLQNDTVIPLDKRFPLFWTYGEKIVMLFLADLANRDPEFLSKLQTQSEAALYLSDLTGHFLSEKVKRENERWREWHEEKSDAEIIRRMYRYIPLDTGYGYVEVKQDSHDQVDTLQLNDPELLRNPNIVTGKKEIAQRISVFRADQMRQVEPGLVDPALLVSEIHPGEFLLKVFAFSEDDDSAHANPDTLRFKVMSPQEVEGY